MDYKKIIKSRSTRKKILRLFDWVPSSLMLKFQYRIKTGRKLNLKNPQRFTEKLQWYKLNYNNPLMKQCVDKYDVREYVKFIGLENILIDCYGVFDCVEDINFDLLPDKFVIKDTLGGGGNSVIVFDKNGKLSIDDLKIKIQSWIDIDPNKRHSGRESVYEGKKHRIIIEKFLDTNGGDLLDYKFLCFDGKATHLYIVSDRKLGNGAKFGTYDIDYNKLDVYRSDERKQLNKIEKPKKYDKMVEYAEMLSKKFKHCRVDLYNIDGKIYFGEITFYDGSGYMQYDPDEFDFELGKKFKLVKYDE